MKPIKDNSNIIAYDDSGYSAGMAKLEMGQLYIAISGEEAIYCNKTQIFLGVLQFLKSLCFLEYRNL